MDKIIHVRKDGLLNVGGWGNCSFFLQPKREIETCFEMGIFLRSILGGRVKANVFVLPAPRARMGYREICVSDIGNTWWGMGGLVWGGVWGGGEGGGRGGECRGKAGGL